MKKGTKTFRTGLLATGLFVFASGFLFGTPAHAFVLKHGENVTVPQKEHISQDLYVGAENAKVDSRVSGDVTLLGNQASFSGTTTEDALLLGGTLNVSGTIGDDVRAAGGNVTFSGSASSSAVLVGATVTLLPSSFVSGDALLLGGTVIVQGTTTGDVTIYGGTVKIDGVVGGNVEVHAKQLIVGSSTEITGSLNYWTPEEAQVSNSAQIKGQVHFHQGKNTSSGFFDQVSGSALSFLLLLIASAVLGLIWRKPFEKTLSRGVTASFGRYLLLGIGLLILIPIISIILVVTVLLAPLGGILLLLYLLFLILSWIAAAMLMGSVVFYFFEKKKQFEISWRSIVLGAVLYTFIPLIPYAGGVIDLIFFLTALGLLGFALGKLVLGKRKER